MKSSNNKIFDEIEVVEIDLQQAINVRDNILSNTQAYYHIIQVPYKHALKTGWFKITWKTETRYRDEQRFDQNRFNGDVTNANVRVGEIQLVLTQKCDQANSLINSMESQLQATNQSVALTEQSHSVLQQQVTALKHKLSLVNVSGFALDSKISDSQKMLSNLNNQCAIASKNLSNVSSKIIKTKTEVEEAKVATSYAQDEINMIQSELDQKKQAAHDKVSSLSDIERATALYGCLAKYPSELLFEMIMEYGFSHEHLAFLALQYNNLDIFKKACEFGVDFDNYLLNENTLAQKIIQSGNIELIEQMFANQKNELINSVIYACLSEDTLSLKQIFDHNNSIFQKAVLGMTPMQVAVANNKFEAVTLILELDSSIAEQKMINNESYFHQAIRMEHFEIAKEIANFCIAGSDSLDRFIKKESKLFEKFFAHCVLVDEKLEALIEHAIGTNDESMRKLCVSKIVDLPSAIIRFTNKSIDILKPLEVQLNLESVFGLEHEVIGIELANLDISDQKQDVKNTGDYIDYN